MTSLSPSPMPGTLCVAKWPDGTKIWRVMTRDAAKDLFSRLIPLKSREWEGWNLQYDQGVRMLFAATVPAGGALQHDAPALLITVVDSCPGQSAPRFLPVDLETLDDEPFVRDISPGLDAKVSWFLIEVLGLFVEGIFSWAPHRLGIPVPVQDYWINLQGGTRRSIEALNKFKAVLANWEARHRFLDEGGSGAKELTAAVTEMLNVMWLDFSISSSEPLQGPLRLISSYGPTSQIEIEQTNYLVVVSATELHGFRWRVSWSFESARQGTIMLPLGVSSEPSLLKMLQEFRIVWPQSDYEAMLDRWLQPGEARFSKNFEVYRLLGAPIPVLWSPTKLWQWVLDMETS